MLIVKTLVFSVAMVETRYISRRIEPWTFGSNLRVKHVYYLLNVIHIHLLRYRSSYASKCYVLLFLCKEERALSTRHYKERVWAV